jgi:SpoIIAA-like
VRYTIENKNGHLHAVVHGRDTAEQMREFLLAVHAACRAHRTPKILIVVRQSRAVFKPEEYGLSGNGTGYADRLVTRHCQIALVGDTHEVNAANEYIEMVARLQGVNVRAFRDERAALRWLGGLGIPSRRYRFTRIVISGAPESAGVYALWDGEELIYYGRTNSENTIRSRLLDHHYSGEQRATHYSWEVCKDPVAREAELLREHEKKFGRPPRFNKAA